MDVKSCNTCGQAKPMVEFYAHPKSADGRMSRCKECHKARVKTWYRETKPERDAYERRRNADPARRAKARQYCLVNTPEKKARRTEYHRADRARHPDRHKARTAVSNALRDGRLVRQPCEICGNEEVQAHHEDYSKPLDVRWLCFRCHREHAHGHMVNVA